MPDPSPQSMRFDNLPSSVIYRNFEKGSCYTSKYSTFGAKRILLKAFLGENDYLDKTMEAVCYLNELGDGGELKHEERCKFLYWFIGSVLPDDSGEKNFSELMQYMYDVLSTYEWIPVCRSLYYTAISKDLFQQRKTVYDYCYDYSKIKEQLEISTNPHKDAYCKHVRNVTSAFSAVLDDCDGDGKSNTYCIEFRKDCQANDPQVFLNENCGPKYGGRTDLGTDTRVLTKTDLGNLPSRQAYDDFNIYWKTYCSDTYVGSIKSSLKTTLETHLKNDKCLNRILGAWYYVNRVMKGGSNPSYAHRCDYFYYWLGDIISKNLKDDSSFEQIMNAIYKQLVQIEGINGCATINTLITTDSKSFVRRKVIFDYLHDRTAILGQPLTKETPCTKAYSKYLQEVGQNYKIVGANCTTDIEKSSDDPCCKLLNEGKGGSATKLSREEISKLTCKVHEGTPEEGPDTEVDNTNDCSEGDADLVDGVSGGEGKGGSDGGGSHRKEGEEGEALSGGVVPAAVSGALAAVGLPALAYFFYKYKSHFFFKEPKHSRIRRNKRSTFRHEFNRFSNGDYSSTDVSTTEYSSTIGSSSNLTAAECSTDVSTVYGGPTSKGRGRANNRRPGNRKNISYQHM